MVAILAFSPSTARVSIFLSFPSCTWECPCPAKLHFGGAERGGEAQLRGNVRSQAQLGNEGSRNGDDDAVEAFGEGGAGALSGAEWAEGVDDGAGGAGAGDVVEEDLPAFWVRPSLYSTR